MNTLLRRWALCSKFGVEEVAAGVWKTDAPGAKLLRPLPAPKTLLVEFRWADWDPSARFVPDEERWKIGWLGRPGARDMREPDCERAWFGANCDTPPCMLGIELWRFIADEGIGIAVELLVIGPSVCAQC